MWAAWLAAFATLASACATVPSSRTALSPCPGATGDAVAWSDYFPPTIFDVREDRHNEPMLKWFGADLAAMGEPVLSCPRAGQTEAYRLLLLRSWQPPWAIRIERAADGAELQATQLSAERTEDVAARPTERRLRHLSASEWERLAAAVRAATFWTLSAPETTLGNDGQTWVIEGLRAGQYHVVERWEPRDGQAYRALGAVFLELAGLGALAVIPPPHFVPPVGREDLKP